MASGHAAQEIVFHTLMRPGDEFLAPTKLYGGSISQFNHAFERCGWHVRGADPADPAAFEALVTEKTRAILVEALANPGGVITDDQRVSAGAGPDIVRVSIGIEEAAELIADLDQALAGIAAG